MEHKIGTRITLEVVEHKTFTCEGCFFKIYNKSCSCYHCLPTERADGKNIIYKEIKYMGDCFFSLKIGRYEIGMYKRFHKYFYNGYIRQIGWFYIYKEIKEG